MNEDLLESHQAGIATLTLNRPDSLNAMSPAMMSGLLEALERLAADPATRVVVLTGAGSAFCAGGDVKGFSEGVGPGSLEERAWGLREAVRTIELLHTMPKPTLAAIPGACAGGGLGLALACDLRIAVDRAKLSTAFGKVGGSGDYGGSYFLSHLVGAAKARELYFLSEVISGAQAAELGIVNQAVAAEAFEEAVQALATRLAALAPVAVGYMKKNLNAALGGATLAQVLDLESTHMARCMTTQDHVEASRAFVEKRAPKFTGQ